MDETKNAEEKSKKEVKIGALVSYLIIIVQILITLVFTPWLSKYLGTSNYGLYTLGTSLAGIFMLDLGLSAASSKFLSEYKAAHDSQKESQFLGLCIRLYLIIDAVLFSIMLILFFFLNYLYQGLTESEYQIFRIIYLIVGGYSLISLPLLPLNGVLTADESFVFLKMSTLFQRILSVGLMSVAICLNWNVEIIMLIYSGTALLISFAKLFYAIFHLKTKIDFHFWDKALLGKLFAFSVWIAIITFSQRLTITLVPQVLGIVYDTKAVAVYGFASQLEMYTNQITTVVAGMFMPRIARILNKDPNSPELYDLFVKVGKFQLFLTGLIFIGFCCLGHQFVIFLMGPDYEDAYLCAVLLIGPSIVFTPKTPMESHCYLVNNVKYEAFITLGFSALAFGLFFLFGSRFGAIGVSAVYCVSITVMHIFIDFFVYQKKGGIEVWKFCLDCYLPYLPVAVLTFAVGFGVAYFWGITNWWILIVQAAIIMLANLLSCWWIFLTKSERKKIEDSVFFKKKTN